ncbi:hypothetical protein M3J09_013156 [Ascochyta lentis]
MGATGSVSRFASTSTRQLTTVDRRYTRHDRSQFVRLASRIPCLNLVLRPYPVLLLFLVKRKDGVRHQCHINASRMLADSQCSLTSTSLHPLFAPSSSPHPLFIPSSARTKQRRL